MSDFFTELDSDPEIYRTHILLEKANAKLKDKEALCNWLLERDGVRVYGIEGRRRGPLVYMNEEQAHWHTHQATLFNIEPLLQEKSDDEVLAEQVAYKIKRHLKNEYDFEIDHDVAIASIIKEHYDSVNGDNDE